MVQLESNPAVKGLLYPSSILLPPLWPPSIQFFPLHPHSSDRLHPRAARANRAISYWPVNESYVNYPPTPSPLHPNRYPQPQPRLNPLAVRHALLPNTIWGPTVFTKKLVTVMRLELLQKLDSHHSYYSLGENWICQSYIDKCLSLFD